MNRMMEMIHYIPKRIIGEKIFRLMHLNAIRIIAYIA
jgi:hypothetical protein